LISRLLALDSELSQQLQLTENQAGLRAAAALFAHSGDSWLLYLGLGLLWLAGPEPWKRAVGITFLGIVVAAVVVAVMKYTFRRQRPDGDWGKIYRITDPHSFPSGHAARVALLSVLAFNLLPLPLALAVLIWALLVILARVAMGVHYLSDVIAGAIIGVILAIGILIFFL
jgi:undecaprenyl-diphosphatase